MRNLLGALEPVLRPLRNVLVVGLAHGPSLAMATTS